MSLSARCCQTPASQYPAIPGLDEFAGASCHTARWDHGVDLAGKRVGIITLDEAWAQGAQAYRSVALPGFPNFFMLIGPNSPIGNYSLISIAELQIDYIMQLVQLWREGRAREIEPTAAATRRFNDALKGAMKDTVWVSGCQSWYLDQHGNPAMWPWTFARFRAEMARPALAEFELKAAKPARHAETA